MRAAGTARSEIRGARRRQRRRRQGDGRYYVETFGMVGRAPPLDENGYAPKSPPGSRLLTFSDPKETMGLLLQPVAAKVDAGTELDVGDVYGGVVVVTNSQRMASRAGDLCRTARGIA